ncbi:ABC transporter substrate-binding protein [Methylobacterium sp. SD21]|uniref:MlaC/ttg2D family ABC transporter substrate-binding protein n=1 Tax=Methylobacterium litchii TaxID=3138810 RepID=UPI00313BE3C8
MRLIRRFAVAAILALPLAAPAQAGDEAAIQNVRDLYAAFSGAVKDGAGPLPARVEAVTPVIDKVFDFPAMARIAVGSKWSGFTPEQQQALTKALKRSLTVTYANRLSQAAGGQFEVMPKIEMRGAQRVVPTKVTTVGGDDSEVDFVVNADDRVQDVLLNGDVSELAAQRTLLSKPLASGGADGAVKFLNERADGMLAAKPASKPAPAKAAQ